MKYAALGAILCGTAAIAGGPPDPPDGGINFYYESNCTDKETNEVGYCYLGRGVDGTEYLTFWQNDRLMFIRKITGDSYITIWTADEFASI